MSKYSRKDYEAVAKILSDEATEVARLPFGDGPHGITHTKAREITLSRLRYKFGVMFRDDNPRFDRNKFEAASQPKE